MLDGTIKTGMRSDFDIDQSLELIYENGRPSYFREKSPLLSWADDKGGIIISPMYPTGLIIRPVNGPGSLAVDDIDVKRVRSLAEINSPIVLKGFVKKPNRERLIELSYRFGTPLPWKFGLLLEVKDQGQESQGLNNVLSSEPMPMHYDGLFKMTKQADEDGREKIVSSPPRYVAPFDRDNPSNLAYSLTPASNFSTAPHLHPEIPASQSSLHQRFSSDTFRHGLKN